MNEKDFEIALTTVRVSPIYEQTCAAFGHKCPTFPSRFHRSARCGFRRAEFAADCEMDGSLSYPSADGSEDFPSRAEALEPFCHFNLGAKARTLQKTGRI
jgi:hypothetical protein